MVMMAELKWERREREAEEKARAEILKEVKKGDAYYGPTKRERAGDVRAWAWNERILPMAERRAYQDGVQSLIRAGATKEDAEERFRAVILTDPTKPATLDDLDHK